MAKTQDYTSVMQEMFAGFPADSAPLKEAFRAQTVLGEKLSRVALEAAQRSTELSVQWSRDNIARMGDVVSAKEQPADYARAFNDFAGAAAELTNRNLAAYAEIVRKVQSDTVELMLNAGKDFADNAQSAGRDMAAKVGAQAGAAASAVRSAQKEDAKV